MNHSVLEKNERIAEMTSPYRHRAVFKSGAGLIALGSLATVATLTEGWVWLYALGAIGGGFVLIAGGVLLLFKQRSVVKEVERVEEEWRYLENDLRRIKSEGGNVSRFLQEKGYRFHVRHWIKEQAQI